MLEALGSSLRGKVFVHKDFPLNWYRPLAQQDECIDLNLSLIHI